MDPGFLKAWRMELILKRPQASRRQELMTSLPPVAKQALGAARVRILKQRDLTAPGGKMMGFFLETDGDAYRVLTQGG
jgi:hypothetical protein